MKITALRTLRAAEFANILWVEIETDAGITGLGETFYGAGAVAAHIHDTLAPRLLGRAPFAIEALHREMLNLPMGQASTGAEHRAASAIDLALWDIFGKAMGQPVWQMLGGRCWDRLRLYNTCAGTRYVRSHNIRPVSNWNRGEGGDYEDLDAFMTRPAELAEELLDQGITAMKIWPFDPHADEFRGQHISGEGLKAALRPFEAIRRAVGDRMDIMLEMHGLWALPAAKVIPSEVDAFRPYWYEDPVRMTNAQALAEFARATATWTCASETLGTRFAYKDYLDRDAMAVVMADLCWTGGLTEGRKIAAQADTYHRPFAAHDCIGPVGFVAGIHAGFSQPNTLIQESVRAAYLGWYLELVEELPRIEAGYVYPPEGAGLGMRLRADLYTRPDLETRMTEG
ncbi:mandelate racemase/muconate lactonizing enzyme family protein (plasmid) [Thioclava sp. 'Guangxiensis']|uniref:mandelate racemase/muconate lactonizing enzyme family protein n=1 Tax=Thioclava sp. 'Guangxiensis' TaxID=3149044 RepID=UPI0032C46AF1